MSFFGSKKRRHISNIDNIVTDIAGSKQSDKNLKLYNFKTSPESTSIDNYLVGSNATDQNKHLNMYINELVKENERLQNVVDDAKTTTMLNKLMLNDYVNQINEQAEEIKLLKEQNSKLQAEVQRLSVLAQTLENNETANSSGLLQLNKNNFDENTMNRNGSKNSSKLKENYFENRQNEMLKEIDRLRTELQSFIPLLDDEPERTMIRKSITYSKEIMNILGEESR